MSPSCPDFFSIGRPHLALFCMTIGSTVWENNTGDEVIMNEVNSADKKLTGPVKIRTS